MKNVIVCMARDEDHYIDEWLLYHFKLGFSDAWVYQNKWRYSGPLKDDPRVHLEVEDEPIRAGSQSKAYNAFIRYANKRGDIGFAAFFDVDEFMCLKPGLTLDGFLSRFTDVSGVALNWRYFGDSGLKEPVDGDYSVLRRFTWCGRRLARPVKTIVNIKVAGPDARICRTHTLKSSLSGDCVLSAGGTSFVHDWKHSGEEDPPAWLNHYFCKTRAEFELIKRTRRRDGGSRDYLDHEFDDNNKNEVEDLTARNFYFGGSPC